jgi:hypothetical protein
MRDVERNISVELSSVNMTDSESKQDGSGLYAQPNVGPWFLRDSNINNCTASSTVVWMFADGGSSMNYVNFYDNDPCCDWARCAGRNAPSKS